MDEQDERRRAGVGWTPPEGIAPQETPPPSPPPASPPPAASSGAGWGQPTGPGWEGPGWGRSPGPPVAPAPVLRPGIVPLRPLSLGELYDGAFQALRTNPRTMLGVTAVVVTAVALVDLVINLAVAGNLTTLTGFTEPGQTLTQENVGVLFGSLEVVSIGAVVSTLFNLIGLLVVTGLLTFAVSEAVLGRKVAIGQLWRRTRGRLLALVGLTLLVALAYVVAVVTPVLPGLALLVVSPLLGVVVLVLGAAVAIVAFGWLYGRLALATPALLLEDQGVLGAWRRSWRLSARSFWRVLGIVLLTVVITVVTAAIVNAPFLIVSLALGATSPGDPAAAAGVTPPQLLLQSVGTMISSTIVYPFTAAVTALLYIDLRMRREGLDVQLARAAARGPGT